MSLKFAFRGIGGEILSLMLRKPLRTACNWFKRYDK